tara:strand:+ start:79 stop:777 length:699 start_codon:yes stop_codon:yes gene_type:complete
MAINVDTVYQRVLALANKEQRGYITPQEFNLLANQAEMEIFEQYFYDLNKRERLEPTIEDETEQSDLAELIKKKLKPFTSIVDVFGGTTFPAHNYHTGKIFYNNRVCRKVDLNEIQRFALSSRHIGGVDPVYAESYTNGEDIIVYSPSGVISSSVTCESIVGPTSVVAWGYVVVNEKALYNSNTSTNFQLHDSEETNLVYKILENSGVVINKPGLITVGQQKQLSSNQIKAQ